MAVWTVEFRVAPVYLTLSLLVIQLAERSSPVIPRLLELYAGSRAHGGVGNALVVQDNNCQQVASFPRYMSRIQGP